MRIGLLSAWASRLGGGVFEAVVGHGHMIAAQGDEPILFALEDEYSAKDKGRFPGKVYCFPVSGPRALGYTPTIGAALDEARLDALHLHGIWMYLSNAGRAWAARSSKPYIISPHGMLDPWILGRGKLKKSVARIAYERRGWHRATYLHALTPTEANDIRNETGRTAVIVPNALASTLAPSAHARQRIILALGRIHPKKNLSGLIQGWAASQAADDGWTLTIAGWGELNHVTQFEAELAALNTSSIRFVGPAFGELKETLFATARYFILPSFSEGLPLAILEAWAAGLPTIQSEGCNLPQGIDSGAALLTGTSAQEIASVINHAISLPAQVYAEMADCATRLIEDSFSPAVIGQRWAAIYRGQA